MLSPGNVITVITVEPRLMTTLLIPPPRYRDHILSTLTLETLVILLF